MGNLTSIVNLKNYQITDQDLINRYKSDLDQDGVVTLPNFITKPTIRTLIDEANEHEHLAYYTSNTHNVYLSPSKPELGNEHVYNHQLVSSKGCICTDQIPENSALLTLYNHSDFQKFIAGITGEKSVYPYADTLSSVNVHYAGDGQELNWHFDNSEFAITLLLQSPHQGGIFEYVKDFRNTQCNEMNYKGVSQLLNGDIKPSQLKIESGTLVLFRGRNSIHRVTPTIGEQRRILVVFAYNSEPNISLSKTARETFYGRLV